MSARVKEEIPLAGVVSDDSGSGSVTDSMPPPPHRKRKDMSSHTQHNNSGFAPPTERYPQRKRSHESNSSTSLNSFKVGFTIDRESQLPLSQVHSRSRTSPFPTSSVRYGGGGNDGRRYDRDPHGGRTSLSSSVSSSHHSNSHSSRTSAITLLDTNHGRMRRQERNISRHEIQAAIKHGRREKHPANPNLWLYYHNGKKHVISEEESRRLVTTMGTTIDLHPKNVSPQEMANHRRDMNMIHDQTSTPKVSWKSHSILIVDKSGSMRYSDVHGCRTRLGAVWLSLAKDFIDHRINIGTASSMDVVSIVLMGERADVIIDRHPTNTILYNKIVKFFRDSERADEAYSRGGKRIPGIIQPSGHGCYGPSLQKAEDLLDQFDDGDAECALHVLLLSDGKPSDGYVLFNNSTNDHRRGDDRKLTAKERAERKAKVDDAHNNASKTLKECVEKIASKYGRRFNFSAIGMGHKKEYDCLKTLVASASNYGSQANFQVPGLSCAEIGKAITSAATSLTVYQTMLRGDADGAANVRQKRIRRCLRESTKEVPLLTEMVDDSFHIFMGDKVERLEFKSSEDAQTENDKRTFVPVALYEEEAKGVAMKKSAFGEGQERLAFQFFEIGEDGFSTIGKPLVSKESRFIEDDRDSTSTNRDQFAKRFCKIQTTAKSVAEAFNAKLKSIPRLDDRTPRVSFIDCCVYYLTRESGEQFSVIVEPKLDGEFEKWNNNNGWQKKTTPAKLVKREPLAPMTEEVNINSENNDRVIDLKWNNNNGWQKKTTPAKLVKREPLTPVTEKVNSNRENNDGVIDLNCAKNDGIVDLTCDDDDDDDTITVSKNEVAQAFSHFSYVHSGKNMLICDLQGVFCQPTNTFCFTDPAIHYHNARRDEKNKKTRYGRTDMGQKGIDNFFKSHKCNGLCKVVIGGFINAG